MTVAVLGNCHGISIAGCARAMCPGTEFVHVPVQDLWSGAQTVEGVLRGHDLVFVQSPHRAEVPAEWLHKVVFFPMLTFTAFHPDMTWMHGTRIGGTGIETVPSSMVVYHSALAFTAYMSGLTVEETLPMFHPGTYAKLGYLDAWPRARQELLNEGAASGVPLGAMFERWARRGCFMYMIHHPVLHVMEDVTRTLLTRAGLPITSHNVAWHLQDELRHHTIWPVYPGVADHLGLHGDYTFMKGLNGGTMGLPEFVSGCFQTYGEFDRATLHAVGFSVPEYQGRLGLGDAAPLAKRSVPGNPYKAAPPVQFWRNSVAGVHPEDLDPVVDPRFKLALSDRLATAGSCFAQHIARVLGQNGFSHFVPEAAPDGLDAAEARAQGFGVYSARYGNIYTVRQLLQLIRRVQGSFVPQDEAWQDRHGRFVDPFRPQIQPGGFATRAAVLEAREHHFAAVRRMLAEMDVFVFTLGLTEAWRSRVDGAVFPLAPGVAGGEADPDLYEFVNFTVEEVTDDLHAVLDLLAAVNPSCRVILTVSPVPLIATFEPQHALTATTYSKAVLRAAADAIRRSYAHVEYFPSFEIITGAYSRGAYFSDDLREVRGEGVDHVMRVFMRHYTDRGVTQPFRDRLPAAAPSRSELFDIVCEEEAIAT